jgi:hypothetical protein
MIWTTPAASARATTLRKTTMTKSDCAGAEGNVNPMKTEGSIRLCLGCEHIRFEKESSWQTECSAGGGETEFVCGKRHWRQDMRGYGQNEFIELEECLLLANTCLDFTERKP